MSNIIEERALDQIRETYAEFRLISPKSETAMEGSLRTYGQMSPVVCVATTDGVELVDGFKRLRACRRLQLPTINTVLLETGMRGCKASIIQLNRVAQSISDLEEAMVLQSLHRSDGLTQVEIATLMGRDKSWVSRRISLVERLSDEVRHHLVLGLISVSVGREVARLPRGNQPAVLAAVLRRRLGKREVETLVRHLLTRPTWDHSLILANVWAFVTPTDKAPTGSFAERLQVLQRLQQFIAKGVLLLNGMAIREHIELLRATLDSGRQVVDRLEQVLEAHP